MVYLSIKARISSTPPLLPNPMSATWVGLNAGHCQVSSGELWHTTGSWRCLTASALTWFLRKTLLSRLEDLHMCRLRTATYRTGSYTSLLPNHQPARRGLTEGAAHCCSGCVIYQSLSVRKFEGHNWVFSRCLNLFSSDQTASDAPSPHPDQKAKDVLKKILPFIRFSQKYII